MKSAPVSYPDKVVDTALSFIGFVQVFEYICEPLGYQFLLIELFFLPLRCSYPPPPPSLNLQVILHQVVLDSHMSALKDKLSSADWSRVSICCVEDCIEIILV